MMNLEEYLGANWKFSDKNDLLNDIESYMIAESMESNAIDALVANYNNGYLDSGDCPSKVGRAWCLENGLISQVCCAENDYSFSVSYPKGYSVIKALGLKKI